MDRRRASRSCNLSEHASAARPGRGANPRQLTTLPALRFVEARLASRPGEGAAHARIMLVGEQPGDEEDLRGHPFVGPAGRVLDQCLDAAALERNEVFVTNAVKHFKWEPRGKRRLHKKPNLREIDACNVWLDTGN